RATAGPRRTSAGSPTSSAGRSGRSGRGPGSSRSRAPTKRIRGGRRTPPTANTAAAKARRSAGASPRKGEVRKDGVSHVKVGFNWAYATDGGERAFWRYLGHHGGRRFVSDLDWVGLDAYPGTWGAALGRRRLPAETTSLRSGALHALRVPYMPLAGIPHTVPLQVSETGYPTGPGRTDATQVTVMKAAVEAVDQARSRYNITGLRWFDLRDADSASTSFESQ